jgi:hypothetical protein
MSAATEFVPVLDIPTRARVCRPPAPLATVSRLYGPRSSPVASPAVRLTYRGMAVVAAAVAVVALALVALAWLCAPDPPSGVSRPRAIPELITVRPGDTLWSIAVRVAPQRDPRAEVADLQQINQLSRSSLLPGQIVRTR